MNFPTRVIALTQDGLLPAVADNVFGSNPLCFRLIGNGKPGKGTSLKKPIKYQSSGTGTSFSGLQTYAAALPTTTALLDYDWRGYRNVAAISGFEVAINAISETQITDLVVNSLEEKEQEMIDEVGTLLYGTGTGNSNADFLGLGAIVDDATDVGTIGSLARATYPVLNATRTASGGTLTLAKMATLFTNVSSGSSTSNPTLMVSSETVWDLYEQLLTPTVRENYSMTGYMEVGLRGKAVKQGLEGTHGFVALSYKGIPYTRDEKATSQNLFMLNEDWLKWYGIDAGKSQMGYKAITAASSTIEGFYGDNGFSKFTGLGWGGWKVMDNAFGATADIVLLGQLTSFQPRRHGRLTGITGV